LFLYIDKKNDQKSYVNNVYGQVESINM